MARPTYTIFCPTGNREEIIERDVPIERALVIAVEHRRAGKATVLHSDEGEFRIFEIGCRSGAGRFERILRIVIRRSDNPAVDADEAMALFGDILLNNPRAFWNGRIVRDKARKPRQR